MKISKYKSFTYFILCTALHVLLTGIHTVEAYINGNIVNSENKVIQIENEIAFIDSASTLKLKDILNVPISEYQDLAQIVNTDNHSAYWIRFKFSKSTTENIILLQTSGSNNEVELYAPLDSGRYLYEKSGFKVPYGLKDILDNACTFKVKVKKGEQDFYYMRIKPGNGFGLALYPSEVVFYINTFIKGFAYFGFFYGIIFLASLYSLILYFRIKEKAYLYYSLYVFNFGLFASMSFGLITLIPGISNFGYNKNFYTIPFVLMTCLMLLYARSFLNTKESLPIFHKILTWLVVGRVVLYFIGLIFDINQLYNPINDDIFLLGAFVASLIRVIQGYKPARYFLIAFSIAYLGFLVHAFNKFFSPIPNFLLTPFNFYNAGIYEIIFFSFGLAERFRYLKLEKEEINAQTIQYLRENNQLKDQIIVQLNENERLKDSVNRELEQKVKDRTAQLNELNNQLKAQANDIEKMNELLQTDNLSLKGSVKKISEARIMQKRVSFEEFKEIYTDDEACLNFLEELKWKNGFICKKCGNTKYSRGNSPHSRRCSRCNTIERVYTDTIFTGIKFPISKAFYMLFLISTGKDITLEELSKSLDLRKQTCWSFKKRLKEVLLQTNRKEKNKDGWSHLILTTDQS